MKFKSIYLTEESKTQSGTEGNAKKTLLNFLGYAGHQRVTESTRVSGGQTTLTYKGNGEYVVGKNPTYRDTVYYSHDCYYAAEDYTKKQEALMDELYDLIKKRYTRFVSESSFRREFDPIAAPYLPVSVEEYYKDVVRFPGEIGAGEGCLTGIILSVLLPIIIPCFRVIDRWTDRLIDSLGLGDTALFVVPITICLVCFLIGLAFQGIGRLFYGKRTPYEQLTKEQKESYREKYLTYISKKYRGKAGEVLRQFAIERGYDKI